MSNSRDYAPPPLARGGQGRDWQITEDDARGAAGVLAVVWVMGAFALLVAGIVYAVVAAR